MSLPREIKLPRYGIFTRELLDNWLEPIFVQRQMNPKYRLTDNTIGWQASPDSIRVELGGQVENSIKNWVHQVMQETECLTLGQLMDAVGYKKFTIVHINDSDGQTVVTANDFHYLFESIPILLEGFQAYSKQMMANKTATGL